MIDSTSNGLCTASVVRVLKLKHKHRDTWRNCDECYWFQRLSQEVGELGSSLAGDHGHPPDYELEQIAAICMNWLEMREENSSDVAV